MYEDRDAETILAELTASAVEAGWSGEEGSLAALLMAPMSVELAKGYQELVSMIPKFFVDETSGIYIDYSAASFGIYRKEGTCATCTMTLTGTAGTSLPAGTIFMTSDGLAFGLDYDVTIGEDGTATVTATAQATGAGYNISAGELVQMYVTVSGLISFSNDEAVGGSDLESDASLFDRLDTERKKPATSGNVAHYQQWALECAGVGYVKVNPLAYGAGTVGVVLASSEGGEVSDDIVENCADYIETVRPIGASVMVESVEGLEVTIEAVITIDTTTTITAVIASFQSKLEGYMDDLLQTWADSEGGVTLLYNRIVFHLLDVDGVVDYASLTVNEGTSNISLDATQVPVLGEVGVSDAT